MEVVLARAAAYGTLAGIVLLICDLFWLRIWIVPVALILMLAFPIFFRVSGWHARVKARPKL